MESFLSINVIVAVVMETQMCSSPPVQRKKLSKYRSEWQVECVNGNTVQFVLSAEECHVRVIQGQRMQSGIVQIIIPKNCTVVIGLYCV